MRCRSSSLLETVADFEARDKNWQRNFDRPPYIREICLFNIYFNEPIRDAETLSLSSRQA